MTIKYANGRKSEAAILTRTESRIRAAVEDADNVVVLSSLNGTWVSEDCEPVEFEFMWQRDGSPESPAGEDCAGSQELAAKLLRLLFTDNREVEAYPSTLTSHPQDHLATRYIC